MNVRAFATGACLAALMANAHAQDKRSQTILECIGTLSGKGIDAPADELFPRSTTGESGAYTIDGKSLIISGGGSTPDARLDLCKSASTMYVYSNDCTANRNAYIRDWLEAKDFDTNTSPFFKKYSNSISFLQTVTVDRVTLHLNDELVTGHVRTPYDEKTHKMTVKPFLATFTYDADCKVAKPKI
jgi:hypothetical protein